MTITATEWSACKLDELGFVGRGKSKHRPRNDKALYGGKYPFFQTGDIKAANFHLTEYSQTYNEKGIAQSKLWEPGTLCITIAANIAETAILGIPGCFPDSIVGFIPHPDKADVAFIKYYIDTIKLQMQSVSRGTTQDNLSVDKLLTFSFRVPSLSLQRRIAGILSAYDELIENNQRRIKTLEEMARSLYREWFVHFHFPGHEHTPISNGVPEGWEHTAFESALILQRGFDLPIQARVEGIVPIYGSTGIIGYHNTAKVMGPGVVTGRSGTLGQVHFISSDFWPLNTVLWVKEFRRVTPLFSVFMMREMNLKHYNGGVSVPTLDRKTVHTARILVPPKALLNTFEEFAAPLFLQIDALTAQAEKLRATRNLLLPRLMSGVIKV